MSGAVRDVEELSHARGNEDAVLALGAGVQEHVSVLSDGLGVAYQQAVAAGKLDRERFEGTAGDKGAERRPKLSEGHAIVSCSSGWNAVTSRQENPTSAPSSSMNPAAPPPKATEG